MPVDAPICSNKVPVDVPIRGLEVSFKSRRGDYIRQRGGRFYYRRSIPPRMRHLFGGRSEWVIALEGSNDSERYKEAQALAHKHDRQMSFSEEIEFPSEPLQAAKFDLAPDDLPPSATPTPIAFYRDGNWHTTFKYAITELPQQRRALEREGYFTLSTDELALQEELAEHVGAHEKAENEDARDLAALRAEKTAHAIEDAHKSAGHTILSILPDWRQHRKQAPTTWKKHDQYAREFADLVGDLPLAQVTKRHVVEYVQHAQTLTYRGEPLSPTSISKRLDSVRALLAYAVSADVIEHNPANGVRPPKDNRPKTSRSWKSFTSDEIDKLIRVSDKIWANRHAQRRADLRTALQCLIWTGARPEEICQLRSQDVDVELGVLHITNDESDDGARARLTKNEGSVRVIPIHSRLLPTLKAHLGSSPLLFPSFEPKPTPAELNRQKETGILEIKGRYSRPISREWTDHLRSKVTTDPRKVLYSLRHSFAAEARRTGMPEHVMNALMGHSSDNPHAAAYGGDSDWTEEKRRHLERMFAPR